MDYKEIVSVPGLPGLYTVLSQKSNGVVVKSLDDDKSQFVSLRTGGFAVLDNISVYTDSDTVALRDVFNSIHKIEAETPPEDPSQSNDALKAYMEKVLPNFDRHRVKISDIKKIIKWYHVLKKHGVVPVPDPEPVTNSEPTPPADE